MVDVPPQHALLALDALGLGERTGHGVVLAGKATDEQVEVRNLALSRLGLLEHLVDILVDAGALAKVRLVAAPGKLLGRSSRRLPLVGPDGLEHGGPKVLVGMVKPDTKSADARKELGHLERTCQFVGSFHLNHPSIRIPQRSIMAKPPKKIKIRDTSVSLANPPRDSGQYTNVVSSRVTKEPHEHG